MMDDWWWEPGPYCMKRVLVYWLVMGSKIGRRVCSEEVIGEEGGVVIARFLRPGGFPSGLSVLAGDGNEEVGLW